MKLPLQPPLFAPQTNKTGLIKGIWLDRNWHLASGPTWSRDLSASLGIDPDVFPEPVPLVLELCVFGASPDQPRVLTLSSPGHADTHVTIRTSDPVKLLTTTPVPGADGQRNVLSLTLDSITSPSRLGLSVDDRLLGVCILSAKADRDAVHWPLDFTDPHASAALLGEGWDTVAAGVGVWSQASQAQIVLPGYLRGQEGDMLSISADVLEQPADSTTPLRVDVMCNNIPVATWHIPPDNPKALLCPLSGWHDNTDCKITLRFHNLRSPREIGINTDPRPLGLMMRKITLTSRPPGEASS